MFGFSKWIIFGAVAAILAAIALSYGIGHHIGKTDGKAGCETDHATTQLTVSEKAHKHYEKIDNQTPYTSDKPARIKWLLDNAVNRQ